MVLLDLGLGRDLAPSWMPIALSVVLLVILGLLYLSMRGHLRKAAKYSGEEGVDIHAPRIERDDAAG